MYFFYIYINFLVSDMIVRFSESIALIVLGHKTVMNIKLDGLLKYE